MKFVVAAIVVILLFWLLNSNLIDRHAPETDGPLGWRNGYSLRGSALANSPDSTSAADEALGVETGADTGGEGGTGAASPILPNTGQRTYIIQPGDTLSSIAVRYGVTVGQILYANPAIQNANIIYAGRPIVIPAPGSPSSEIANPALVSSAAVTAPAAQQPAAQQPVSAAGAAAAPANPASSQTSASQPAAFQSAGARTANLGRWIYVDLASQRVTAYEGNTPVRTFIVSTGIPAYPTDPGTFQIYEKFSAAEMIGQGYDLMNVPYVMYYEQGGYALHGTYWHHNFGTPMSHGCVNLATPDAEWLYNWAPLGTTVVIQ